MLNCQLLQSTGSLRSQRVIDLDFIANIFGKVHHEKTAKLKRWGYFDASCICSYSPVSTFGQNFALTKFVLKDMWEYDMIFFFKGKKGSIRVFEGQG